ncbi:hypothetical protein RQP46_007961 [Phenoliferia psychrophenolica]
MSFLGTRNPGAPTADQETRKQQVMNEVKSQLALANAQELINKMNEKCFEKCIPKPGPSLTSSDETCIVRCTERFLEAFNLISKSYVARLGREREQGGNLDGMH